MRRVMSVVGLFLGCLVLAAQGGFAAASGTPSGTGWSGAAVLTTTGSAATGTRDSASGTATYGGDVGHGDEASSGEGTSGGAGHTLVPARVQKKAATPQSRSAPLHPSTVAAREKAAQADTTSLRTGAPGDRSSWTGPTALIARLLTLLHTVIGIPYLWGGISRLGFDCSGLVQWAFAHIGITLPRTTWGQYAVGRAVSTLSPGDLVFFSTYAPGASHVGIYLGHQHFIDAGNTGVAIADLGAAYWFDHYIGARDVFPVTGAH